eukprot:m.436565 g.436565  ORF g.436565 m.436565 type:complete len:65 (-) comp17993_c0_seq1:471-665(-)
MVQWTQSPTSNRKNSNQADTARAQLVRLGAIWWPVALKVLDFEAVPEQNNAYALADPVRVCPAI